MFFVDMSADIEPQRAYFDEIVNSKWFSSTNVVLIMNMADLVVDRDVVTLMMHKFKKLNRRTGREVYAHTVCSLDTDCVRIVFNAIIESLITR